VIRNRKNGTHIWTDLVASTISGADGQPSGLIAIDRDVTEHKAAEETIRQSRERMRNLAARLMVIREQERSTIARELHDELGQALTGLGFDLRWLFDSLAPRLRTRRAESMLTLVDQLLDRVRHICGELRPAILDDLGLEAAIEWQAQEFADRTGCRCKLDLRLGPLKAQRDRDTAAFRIVQEALTNVARHARARHVTLRGRVTDAEVVLQIEDDGVGFDERRLSSAQALGLLGMRERAEAVGGAVAIESRVRKGAKVKVRMPCDTGRS
jgi:signal transduction histidine kinase